MVHSRTAIVVAGSIALIGEALDRAIERDPSIPIDRSVR